MDSLQRGIVDRVEGNRAFVKLRGMDTAFPQGMRFPIGQTPQQGSTVLVAKPSGTYMIIAVY